METHRSPADRRVPEWRERAARAQDQEAELLIDPGFFWTLDQEIAILGPVKTLIKRGTSRNELTEFRYDVVLHIGSAEREPAADDELRWDWERDRLTLDGLRSRLERAEADSVVVCGIPNARLDEPRALRELRRDSRSAQHVGEIRREAAVAGGVEPEDLFGIGGSLGRVVTLRLADSGDAGRLDAKFGAAHDVAGRQAFPMRHPGPRQEGRSYASDPLRGQRTGALVRHLRGHLGSRLPEHMVPASYHMLDALPLTPNGKLDRKALPDTESDGYARRGYEAPVGETEVTLAELWSEVLGVERVGRRDHFFELGGHSLLAVRLIEPMRRRGLFADVQGAAHRAHAGRNGGDGER